MWEYALLVSVTSEDMSCFSNNPTFFLFLILSAILYEVGLGFKFLVFLGQDNLNTISARLSLILKISGTSETREVAEAQGEERSAQEAPRTAKSAVYL